VSRDKPETRPGNSIDPAESESTSNELVPRQEQHSQPPAVTPGPPASRVLYSPAMDIYETEEGLVLVADLPGVKTETLDLQVQNNNLTLFGRVEEYTPQNAIAIHQEYGVGDFLRSFILPVEVDHDRISAKLSHGVLKVILPKIERAEPRKISIDEGE
jgi:HSP20 family molecular chaperone IbpA